MAYTGAVFKSTCNSKAVLGMELQILVDVLPAFSVLFHLLSYLVVSSVAYANSLIVVKNQFLKLFP